MAKSLKKVWKKAIGTFPRWTMTKWPNRINPRPEDTDQNAPHKGCHPIFPLFFPKGLHTQSPQNQCFHALPPFFSFDGKSITLFLEFYTFFFIGYVPYPAISLHSSPKPANPASFRLLLPSPAPVADILPKDQTHPRRWFLSLFLLYFPNLFL